MVAIRLGHDRYIRSPMFCSECFVQYFMVRQIYIYIYTYTYTPKAYPNQPVTHIYNIICFIQLLRI